MKICGIIIDKDGTLLDFNKFWLSITDCAVDEILLKCGVDKAFKPQVLHSLGVCGDDVDITGHLCSGTYESMSRCIFDELKKHSGMEHLSFEDVREITVKAYHNNSYAGTIAPACDGLVQTLEKLKRRGIRLAVVTTDDPYFTEKCLRGLGIYEFFDSIYTDDGVLPSKPNPHCIEKFCTEYCLDRGEVIMVGDTLTDTAFAKNGGIFCVGVAKSQNNKRVLAENADVVLDDVSQIFEVMEQL